MLCKCPPVYLTGIGRWISCGHICSDKRSNLNRLPHRRRVAREANSVRVRILSQRLSCVHFLTATAVDLNRISDVMWWHCIYMWRSPRWPDFFPQIWSRLLHHMCSLLHRGKYTLSAPSHYIVLIHRFPDWTLQGAYKWTWVDLSYCITL